MNTKPSDEKEKAPRFDESLPGFLINCGNYAQTWLRLSDILIQLSSLRDSYATESQLVSFNRNCTDKVVVTSSVIFIFLHLQAAYETVWTHSCTFKPLKEILCISIVWFMDNVL